MDNLLDRSYFLSHPFRPLTMKRWVYFAAATVITASGCSGRGDSLSGTWSGSDGNLSLSIELSQHGDSIAGTGTYTIADAGSMGCGGSDIPRSGPVTLAGVVQTTDVGAQLRFNRAAWTPPYIGSIVARDTIRGGLMSVDRGRCQITLVRQR